MSELRQQRAADQVHRAAGRRRKVGVRVIPVMLLLVGPLFFLPTPVIEGAPFKAAPSKELQLNCAAAVMRKPATFSSHPKGSATYPFEINCANAAGPGVLLLYFEGRWNPSETRQDKPNAVETLFIENYARHFIDGRQQRGSGDNRIFVYWTARCTADPWTQGGSCRRLGEFVPDDVRAAMPNLGLQPFPLTEKALSPERKQQLARQYQEVNQPASSRMNNQAPVQSMLSAPQQSSAITPSQRMQPTPTQPQQSLIKPPTSMSNLARSGVLSRGLEGQEDQAAAQQETTTPDSAAPSAIAVLEEGAPDIAEPVTVTLDRAVHVTTTNGESVVLAPGVYEVSAILDVQLGLAKEGQPTVLLHAQRRTHSESIERPLAVVVAGQSDEAHLVLLLPDGRRFDTRGSTSGVQARGTRTDVPPSENHVRDAIKTVSARPPAVAPPCRPNPEEFGPRWIPVPCTLQAKTGSEPVQ